MNAKTSAPKSQRTPGPWRVQDDNMGVYYVNPRIEAGEDIIDPRHDSVVARCTGFGAFSGIEDAEVEANARLIAAAPDMLAVLKRLVQWSQSGVPYSSTVTDEAEAAIAKAEQGDA